LFVEKGFSPKEEFLRWGRGKSGDEKNGE